MSNPKPDTNQDEHPKPTSRPPAARFIAAACSAGASVVSACAWGSLAWWMLGRVFSDHFVWSQWAFWTPTELVVAVTGGLIGIGWVAGRIARKKTGRKRRLALHVVWAAVLVWLVLVEWRVWAIAGRQMFGTPESTMSILCWNATGTNGPILHDALPDIPIDLLIITNAAGRVDWDRVGHSVGEGSNVRRLGRAKIITKYSILRWGSIGLGMNAQIRSTRQEGRWFDQGWAAFFELETTDELGSPIVVWVVDLPSDLAIPRAVMARAAADAIHAWQGPALAMIEGTPTVEPLDKPGFPEPDVIIGDFNTPRGSRSLRAITQPLSNAWSDAGFGGGVGPLGSWPRTKPVYHIDQTFLARDLRSCSYKLIDLGTGMHRAQAIRIAKRK